MAVVPSQGSKDGAASLREAKRVTGERLAGQVGVDPSVQTRLDWSHLTSQRRRQACQTRR